MSLSNKGNIFCYTFGCIFIKISTLMYKYRFVALEKIKFKINNRFGKICNTTTILIK